MHDNAAVLDGRVRRWLQERILPAAATTVSTLDVAIAPVTDAEGSSALGATPGVVGQGEPISIEQGLALEYTEFEVGRAWGPAWGTTWMRFRGVVPADLADAQLEAFVDLGGQYESPGFQCEGLVIRPDGSVIKGHNPMNKWIPVEPDVEGRFEFYLEAASNPVVLGIPPFEETWLGAKPTSGSEPIYELRAAELRVVHPEVRSLVDDVATLSDVAATLPEDSGRRWEIRRGLDRALDRLDLDDIPATAGAARDELAPLLASPVSASAHRLVAVGHAHIDSAWLWPLRETRRKVARTIANQLNLLDAYPEHRFAFPAAQHSAWLEEDHPALFARLRDAVASGRIIPVGGMWVESDANLPGGEAMARQLVYGAAYFKRAFDFVCDGVWLPDSFGYSAALPQLARLAGARWFLTQKISWNQVNKFPHHSFWWEGIDGTRIFTHFPPADTYGSDLGAENLHHAATNFRDKGRSDISLVPFGYGDGGGGPTREMLERARRVGNLEGSPKVEVSTPQRFFDEARKVQESPSVWTGELYLELHRGTFTSVADVKQANRRNEHLLREAELWCATAAVRGLLAYPGERFCELWREVLLYQFHDILPGTCISWVYDEVLANHARISAELREMIADAQRLLAGSGDQRIVFNAAPVTLGGVPALGAGTAPSASRRVELMADADGHTIDNGLIRVRIDQRGRVTSLVDLATGRETIPPGEQGGVLQLFTDFPNQWDAWDIDKPAFNAVTVPDAGWVEAAREGDDAVVTVEVPVKESSATLTFRVRPDDARLLVDVHVAWSQRDSLLKLAWPVDVHADQMAAEIEMGHIRRATHENTSWDAERFEVHAHRWVHVGEDDFGVAIANAQTYGWDATRHQRTGGGTYTVVRASLLKGARYPDPRTDVGDHDFWFSVRPGAGIADAVADGYALNLPLREQTGSPVEPLISVDGPIMIEALKLAEDGSGDVIVRCYEPLGRRARARLTASFEATGVTETDLHEAPLTGEDPDAVAPSAIVGNNGGSVDLVLRPFQIVTLRIGRRA